VVVKDSADVEIYSEDAIPTTEITRSNVAAALYRLTPEEESAGVTPVAFHVPSHEIDGVIRLERYIVNSNPGTTDLTAGMTAVNAVRAQITNASAVIELPPGRLYFPNGMSFSPSPFAEQIWLRGRGMGITRIIYDGSGDAISFSTATILQRISDLTLDCSGADAGANGIHFKAWRSLIEGVAITGPSTGEGTSTGSGLLCDGTSGTFDLKTRDLYVSLWGTGINAEGHNLGATAVTNFLILGGYVTLCDVNYKFTKALDVCVLSAQSEGGYDYGVLLEDVQKFTWLGGAIEGSPGYGVYINAGDTGTTGVTIRAGMFNNTNGNIGGTLTGTIDLNGDLYGTYPFMAYNGAAYAFNVGGNINALRAGQGNPEGSVVGQRGDLRLCNDSSASHIKAFGSDTNTGWMEIAYAPVRVTAANLASAAHAINTTNKYAGKQAYTTDDYKLYVARGGTAVSPWDLVDGSASVTPS
jgi:hypothetical protein